MKLLRKCLLSVLVAYFSLIIAHSPVQGATPNGTPVIAYYFNYWGAPYGGQTNQGLNYWGAWNFPKKDGSIPDPNILDPGREPWRRAITTGDNVTYPLIGPYDSSSSDIARWQVRNAKNAGIDAFVIFLFSADFNKTTQDADDTAQRSRMWWTTGHVTVPTIEQESPFKFLIGQDEFGFNNNDPLNSETCDYNTTACGGHPMTDFPLNVQNALKANVLTQKKYADVVLNAYSALSKWKDSPGYMKVDNKPAYFFAPLEPYRNNPAKLGTSFRTVESLLGNVPVYWFGYDGFVTWGLDSDQTVNWSGIVNGLDDGWGVSKGIIYEDTSSYTNTRSNVNAMGQRITGFGLDWIPNIQTSFDDTVIRYRDPTDVINAATHLWLKRSNGETFKKSLITNRDSPYPKKMYFLSSWNATPLEGYSVEPAVTWGDDASFDPYQYLKILATHLTGAVFNPAPLPDSSAIDQIRVPYLYTNSSTCVSNTIPTSMNVGETRTVTVTMKNTGTSTWFPSSNNATNYYRLGNDFPNFPANNLIWGVKRISLPAGTAAVLPNSNVTFSFDLTAPSTPGTYPSMWQMVHELIQWFGPSCGQNTITVNPDPGFQITVSANINGIAVIPSAFNLSMIKLVNATDPTKEHSFTFRLVNNGAGAFSGTANVTNVPNGNYNLLLKVPSSLWRRENIFTADGTNKSFNFLTNPPLLLGDIDGNNRIDLLDLARMVNARTAGSLPSDSDVPENLNINATLDSTDQQILLQNYSSLSVPGD